MKAVVAIAAMLAGACGPTTVAAGETSAPGTAASAAPPLVYDLSKAGHAECPTPIEYPDDAARDHATGVTVLIMDVGVDGAVSNVAVLRGVGSTHAHRLLDDAARTHFAACRYRWDAAPPAAAQGVVAFTWNLE